MGKRLELQIQDTSAALGYFHFDVEGEWSPRLEPIYNAGNPPVLAEIREVWEFRDCRLVTTDGTVATLWSGPIAALRSAVEDRSAHPTYVRLVRDPRAVATETVLVTLGVGGSYEDLRIESVEGSQDPDVPGGSWSSTATFNVTVSAIKKLPHATTGIVTFGQRVSTAYRNGLRALEWRTTITTKEGTSAVTKAEVYARIPDSALGGNHAFDTNGPNGIDFEYTDADESQAGSARVPTVCVAVSRIRQFGEGVGATSAGTSANDYQHWTEVEITPDGTKTTFFALAQGPNASTYVASKKPAGALAVSIEHTEPTANLSWGRWEKRTSNPKDETAEGHRDEFSIKLTPGAQVQLWRTISGNQLPHQSVGGLTWWRAEVFLSTFKLGSEDISFPGKLPAPWVLQATSIEESSAEVVGERQLDASTTLFVRRVRLSYFSAIPPQTGGEPALTMLGELRAAARIRSYAFEAANV